ncbi:MAG: TonB family protein, partial [Bacteroidota bacterium]
RTAEADRQRQALDGLRAQIIARDEAIELLTAERDERGTQVGRLTTELERVNGLLTQTRAERDAARADLVALNERLAPEAAEVARLRAEVDRLGEALAQTRAERDRLAELTSVQGPELASGEAEIDRLQAEIASVRQRLAEHVERLGESESAREALQAEADALRDERDALAASGDTEDTTALRAERDRLAQRVEALEAEIRAIRERPTPPETPEPPSRPAPEATSRAAVSFPGFDMARLTNLDEVTEQVSALRLPADDARGEVLVLFQTDPEGRVIRTAVARRIGNGLDEAAESLVQAMRFEPPTVDGQPTGLRSQVRVKFGA